MTVTVARPQRSGPQEDDPVLRARPRQIGLDRLPGQNRRELARLYRPRGSGPRVGEVCDLWGLTGARDGEIRAS